MPNQGRLAYAAWIIVRAGSILNRLFLAAVLLGLVLSWILIRPFEALLSQSNPDADVHSMIMGMRLEMLIGIVASLATIRLLFALKAILGSARAGDPFMASNANHFQTMGWALLTLQLLDIPAALLGHFFPSLGSAAPNGDVSLGGWMAVLLLFVLARVFAAGTAMRDDLEGTI